MKPITVINGPFEPGGSAIIDRGFLVAPGIAMYVSSTHRQLWLQHVTVRDYDTCSGGIGVILSENVIRDDREIIAELYANLRGMDGFEFVCTVLVQNGVDIEMFPPEESILDET
ncbi:hypothetical protein [Paenibacillus sp. LPE1-1-1.1]|uniref:hypothetical protein n=1 Tax=Paenibacillus sp. LPE1-1-1.1 TaxID=3135230 RepID=UPI003422AFDC